MSDFAAVSVSAAPVWENMGTATSESTHRVEREMENGQMRFVENQTVGNMGLRPATPSTFAVTAGAALRAQGDSASTGDTTGKMASAQTCSRTMPSHPAS